MPPRRPVPPVRTAPGPAQAPGTQAPSVGGIGGIIPLSPGGGGGFGGLGGLGTAIFGESPADRFDAATQNEFRQVGDIGAFADTGAGGRNRNAQFLSDQFLNQGDPFSGFDPGVQTLLGQLQQQALGQGPGQQLAQLGAERGIAQQLGAAGAARGAQGALAARGAAQNIAGIGAAAGQQGLQAQLAAQQGLGGLLSGLRGQDLNSQLQAQQLRQSGALGAGQLELSNAELFQQALIERERQRGQRFGSIVGGAATAADAATTTDQIIGAATGVFGLGGKK